MTKKLSIKDRLRKKTCKELSAIYVRITGINLLRGSKTNQIIVLHSLLESSKNWAIISNIH